MKPTKLLSLVLATLLFVSVLSSCDQLQSIRDSVLSGNDSSGEDIEFTADPSEITDETERHDLVFTSFLKNLEKYKDTFTFPYSEELDCDYYCKILTEVLDSHKELFWLTGTFSCTVSESEISSSVEIVAESFLSTKDIKKGENDLNSALEAITGNIPAEYSDFEKVLFIHDQLILNTVYNSEYAEKYSTGDEIPGAENVEYNFSSSAYGALVSGKAMCLGYSSAFQLCMNTLGIDCVCITGEGKNDHHAWNKVKVMGDWYNIDVTWDDKDMSYPSYAYFLLDDNEFGKDHNAYRTSDSDMTFVNLRSPECVSNTCNYHVYYGLVFDSYNFYDISGAIRNGMNSNGFVSLKFTNPSAYDEAMNDLFHLGKCYSIDGLYVDIQYYTDTYPVLEVYSK